MAAKLLMAIAVIIFLASGFNGFWLNAGPVETIVIAILGGVISGGLASEAWSAIQDEKEYRR